MLLSYQWTDGIGDHSRGGLRSSAACIGVPWKHGRAHAQAQTREALLPKEEDWGGMRFKVRLASHHPPDEMYSMRWVPVPLVHLHARLSSLRWLDVASAIKGWRRISFPVPWSLVRHGAPEEARHLVAA